MGTLIVVEGDSVEGTDKHNVTGVGTPAVTPPPSAPFSGIADFDYKGSMTDKLSDFVSIGGSAVAVISSQSSLDPGEDSIGGHSALSAKNIVATTPPTVVPSSVTMINDAIGIGTPSQGTGSAFVKVDGVAVLFDGDTIDTCDGLSVPANSTVTSENQDFVQCSE